MGSGFSSPKELLSTHEYLSWAGILMDLVHAGWHFNAVCHAHTPAGMVRLTQKRTSGILNNARNAIAVASPKARKVWSVTDSKTRSVLECSNI
jgi:hypothetical protein